MGKWVIDYAMIAFGSMMFAFFFHDAIKTFLGKARDR